MGHFYDADEGGPLRLELRSVDGRDFTMLRRLGYRNDDYAEPFVVPREPTTFTTDLASVPAAFTWLVPKSGDFLPAAVLHDALVLPGSWQGPEVDRPEADRIFRDAMIGLGTGRVRAWLMWAAVSLSTMWHSRRLVTRLVLISTLAVIAVLGVIATLDLVDVWDVLPWMGDRVWWQEVIGGAAAAALIPTALTVTWGRWWPAGIIVGVALAFLLHVSAAIVLLTGTYLALERLVSGPANPRGVRWQDRTPD